MTSITSSSLSSALMQQIQQARQNLFQKADTDASGGLSLDEFKAAGPKDAKGNAIAPTSGASRSIEDMFSSLDADGDGSLTQGEMDSGFSQESSSGRQSLLSSDMVTQLLSQLSDEQTEAFFNSADQDGDGGLSSDEFTSAIEDMVTAAIASGEAPAGPPPGGPPPGGGGGKGGNAEDASPTQVYDALDTNQDGTVSLDELLASNESEEEDSSSILSMLQFTSRGDQSQSSSQGGLSANALKTDFTKFLLSMQEQQQQAA